MKLQTVLLLGSTGLTGSYLREMLCKDDSVNSLILPVRRTVPQLDKKEKIVVTDFDHLYQNKELFDVDIVYCALGTTIKKAKTEANFYKIDHDYVIQSADYAAQKKVKRYVVVSSIGANTKSPFSYQRVKGEMENDLSKADIPSIFVLRPAQLLGERNEKRQLEFIAQGVGKVLQPLLVGPLSKYRPIKARHVAQTMHILKDIEHSGYTILESNEIKQYINR